MGKLGVKVLQSRNFEGNKILLEQHEHFVSILAVTITY